MKIGQQNAKICHERDKTTSPDIGPKNCIFLRNAKKHPRTPAIAHKKSLWSQRTKIRVAINIIDMGLFIYYYEIHDISS